MPDEMYILEDVYGMEDVVLNAAHREGYEAEKFKTSSIPPSPDSQAALNLDFLLGGEEEYAGVRVRYTPFSMKLMKVSEDDMREFLTDSGVIVEPDEGTREALKRQDKKASLYKTSDYNAEMAEQTIEEAAEILDGWAPQPRKIDAEDTFFYKFPLE